MRLNKEKQERLEEPRMDYAIRKISELGYEVDRVNDNMIQFKFKDKIVSFYPYSGWAAGKSITDGRGIDNLLKQIKP